MQQPTKFQQNRVEEKTLVAGTYARFRAVATPVRPRSHVGLVFFAVSTT